MILTRVVQDVPFKRNRLTKLRGSLFNSTVTSAMTVETAWLDDAIVNF